MGRPKGSRNKASRELLWKLEKEHDFFVVEKIVELYNEISIPCKPLVQLALRNVENNLSPTTGMSLEDIEILNNSEKNRWNILSKFLAYCYPKLKALDVNTGVDHDQIKFNISIPKSKIEVTHSEDEE